MRGAAVLAIAVVMVLGSGPSSSAVADPDGSSTRLTAAAGEAKAGPEQSVKKQVTSRAKEAAKASPGLVNRPERDGRILELLWLLTGSSRRR